MLNLGGAGRGPSRKTKEMLGSFSWAFFEAKPEDRSLLGRHLDERRSGRDCEGDARGKAGFAGLGLSGEDREIATREETLNEEVLGLGRLVAELGEEAVKPFLVF